MPLLRRIFAWVLPPVLTAIVFHRHIDVVGPVIGVILVVLLGIYALVPGITNPRTGEVLHDKAPIPELLRRRRERRRAIWDQSPK